MQNEQQLLRQYITEGSETAFSELVARYLNLVYSTALRRLNGDAHRAQDAAQLVFTDLARKARRLPQNIVLVGWLHRAACYALAQLLREERRRLTRERQAVAMETLSPDSIPDWESVRPLLDEALERLNRPERDAVLLRVVEGRSFEEVGGALQLTAEAARKRVSRALEKLRADLVRRGVGTSAAGLAAAISAHAMESAPAGLAGSLASASLAGAAAGGGTALTALTFMSMTNLKIAVSAVLVAGVLTVVVLERTQVHALARLRTERDTLLERQASQEAELERLRVDNQRLVKLKSDADELARLRRGEADVLRLRGEVGRLRQEQQAARPVVRQWAAEELANAGKARPEDALQTFLWAGANHQPEELQRAVVPDQTATPSD